MANVSSSNGLEKRPALSFRDDCGREFPSWHRTTLGTIIEPYSEKVHGEHDFEVLTSSREGLQRQIDHFGSQQRHDTDGYNIIPLGFCTYRNRSDDGRFTFNINKISDKAIVSKFYPVFRFKNANSTFMTEYLNSSARARKKLSVLAVGTSQVVLSFEALKSAKFDLPCKEEQDKIASLLECLNERVELQRSFVDALKKYKRGLQNRFFFKRSHLSPKAAEIDSHDVEPLGSVVHINPKTGSLPEAFIYIDLECVESGVLNSKKLISRNSAPSRAQRLLEEGDLLYQMVRPYQKNNYYFQKGFEYPTVASTGYAQIRCSEMDTQFIYEQLSSDYFAREAMLRSTGTGYPAINADDLAEIPIWVPPLNQQEKIGAALSFLGEKIEVHQKLLSALCSVKSSLLQQLFI